MYICKFALVSVACIFRFVNQLQNSLQTFSCRNTVIFRIKYNDNQFQDINRATKKTKYTIVIQNAKVVSARKKKNSTLRELRAY